jgi:putative membrane-bound dehydrogenase-like protein
MAVTWAALSPWSVRAADPRLQAGAAVADITPEVGAPIVGGFTPLPSKAVHDPLHARCLVLDDGSRRMALVVLDLLAIHRQVSDEARKRIHDQFAIPPDAVLISATHTHSATSALGGPAEPAADGSRLLDPYQQQVVAGIVDGVGRAIATLRPAEAGFGAAAAPDHVFNRRWFMKPGAMPPNPFGEIDQVKMNPPPGSPDLLDPAGPTNPMVSFLSVRERGGRPIALYASYGLHYVGGVGDGDISADYFGLFAAEVARLLAPSDGGPALVAMLANGASGDINNINFLKPRPRQEPYEQMRHVAHDVARRVAEAVPGVAHSPAIRLDARYRELEVHRRVPTPEQMAWATKALEGPEPPAGKADLPRIYARRTLDLAAAPPIARLPLQALRIGSGVIASMPCEVFCEIGQEFLERSELSPAIFVSLGHGSFGYLPSARHHRLGGYETWLGTNKLEPAAAAAMLDALVGMTKELAAAGPPTPVAVKDATVVAPGYQVRLAAAEPTVVDPVAITFDEQGRPYVVEYRDYPSGPPPGSPPLSRVVRLDDADGDGFFEGSTVVAESVSFAQGVLAIRGGLLVTAAPDVLMLVDDDGDGRADRREVIATGFKVGNPQLRAACPQIDIDNSVSITGGLSGGVVTRPGQPAATGVSIDRRDVRIDLASGRISAATGFGQFGNAFDDLGRRFTTSNRNPVIAVRLPADALGRNTFVDLGGGFEDAAPSGAASRVFSIAETYATAVSHTGTHTSACGMTVFRGDLLGPDAVGDVFICEPVSHLVTRRRLRPSGASFASDHVGPDDAEFLASRDPWFRPVFTATGPDGALWVVDMCRRTIEHPQYMPPGLAETLDLRAGDRAGRIWRIQRDGMTARPWAAPTTAAAAVALFSDPNGWRRTTAQRLLVEGRFPEAETEVRKLLSTQPPAIAVVHALWTLHGLGRITAADVREAAGAAAPGIRETAARLAPLIDPTDLAAEIADRLGGDDDAHVRLAATLAAAGSSAPSATATLAAAAGRVPHDPWIDRAVLSGAVGRTAPLLEAVASASAGTTPDEPLVDFVERLAATAAGVAASGDKPADADAVVAAVSSRAAAGQSGWFDMAVLTGLASRMPLERLAATSSTPTVPAVLARAEALVADATGSAAARAVAIRLLGIAARASDATQAAAARAALVGLVGSNAGGDLQAAAVAAITRSGDAAAIGGLLEAVSAGDLEPAVRNAAVTALADRLDAAAKLLAAIEAKLVSASVVPLDRRVALARSPDAAIREAAARIWNSGGGAGLSEEEIDGIVATVRAGGSVDRGRELFVKHCAACHQPPASTASPVVGQQVGPALAEAADRPIEQIVVSIVDPNRAVEPRWESTVVVTEDGEVIEGIVAESGQDAVVIVRAGGERRTVPRQQIETLRASGRSLMPEGFGRILQPADHADLVAFLRGGRPVPRTAGTTAAAAPVAAATAGAIPRLRAGAHVEDISPSRFPVPVNGSMQQVTATEIRDPMNARCLAIDDGGRQVVLVVIDACMVPREVVDEAKKLAGGETGIPPERILISATHTHSAAALTPVFQCEVDAEYVATVAPRIARGIVRAVANLEPAEVGWAASSAPDQVFHRRWFMKPTETYENPFGVTTDRVRMNPGAGNRSVSVPAGPVDQEVAVLAVRAAGDQRPIAVLANYSLHYVGGGQPISGDYFAAFAAELSRRLAGDESRFAGKPPFVAILSNGTSGNINNVNYALSPKHKADAADRNRVVAHAVADAAQEAIQAIEWRADATLDAESEQLSLAVRKGSPPEIAQAKAWLESIPKNADGQWADVKAIYARETLKLAEYPDAVSVPLQVLRIGDLSIAAIPCEVFVETGLRLKRTSPFARHFTVSLANGYNGYLPQASDHPLGGYETWRARSSYLEVEAETKVVAALERMAAALAARRPAAGRPTP